MKSYLTIALILTLITANGQKYEPTEFGIGFAIATNPFGFGKPQNPNDFFIDKELSKKIDIEKIAPFFHKPDYGLYHFICLEKTVEYYKILINKTEIGFIPNDSNYYFKTWDGLLLNSTVVRNNRNNQIKLEWTENSQTILNECSSERLDVRDVIEKNGEYWISISFSPTCEVYLTENTEMKNGWIKWRTNEKLLIEILLLN